MIDSSEEQRGTMRLGRDARSPRTALGALALLCMAASAFPATAPAQTADDSMGIYAAESVGLYAIPYEPGTRVKVTRDHIPTPQQTAST